MTIFAEVCRNKMEGKHEQDKISKKIYFGG